MAEATVELPLELFPSLTSLELKHCKFTRVEGLVTLRPTLKVCSIIIINSMLASVVQEIVVPDTVCALITIGCCIMPSQRLVLHDSTITLRSALADCLGDQGMRVPSCSRWSCVLFLTRTLGYTAHSRYSCSGEMAGAASAVMPRECATRDG